MRYEDALFKIILFVLRTRPEDDSVYTTTLDPETRQAVSALYENVHSPTFSDDELAERRKQWSPPPPRVRRGALAKYARLVGDASHGAVTDQWDD